MENLNLHLNLDKENRQAIVFRNTINKEAKITLAEIKDYLDKDKGILINVTEPIRHIDFMSKPLEYNREYMSYLVRDIPFHPDWVCCIEPIERKY